MIEGKQETHNTTLQERLGNYWRTVYAFVPDFHGVLVVVYGVVHACRCGLARNPLRKDMAWSNLPSFPSQGQYITTTGLDHDTHLIITKEEDG